MATIYDNRPMADVPLATVVAALAAHGIPHRIYGGTRNGCYVTILRAKADGQDAGDMLRDLRTIYGGMLVQEWADGSARVAFVRPEGEV